eukprot:UC4_evm1s542
MFLYSLFFGVALSICMVQITQSSFTVGITGDVNLNPALNVSNLSHEYPWGNVLPFIRAVDFAAIQHESTLAEIPDGDPATIQFEDPANFTETYQAAGIDFISMANNHQFDFGIEGLRRSRSYLDKLGIPFGGVGFQPSRDPIVVTKENDVNIAIYTIVVDECWMWANKSLYLDGCTCGQNADPSRHPPYQCYEANSSFPGLNWYQFGIDDALISESSEMVRKYKHQNP